MRNHPLLCSLLAATLTLLSGLAPADTNNLDPSFNGPQGYAQVDLVLGGTTALSSRPRRMLVRDDGKSYLVGTGRSQLGVSPAQSAVTVVALDANGGSDLGFFGTGRRAFKLAPGNVLTDSIGEDATLLPQKAGYFVVVGRYSGQAGGFAVALDFSGNVETLFGSSGVRYFTDITPYAVASDSNGIYVVGTEDGGPSLNNVKVRALTFLGADRTEWGTMGATVWGHIEGGMSTNFDDLPTSAAIDANGKLWVVGRTTQSGSNVVGGHVVIIAASGAIDSAAAYLIPGCVAGARSEFDISRVVPISGGALLAMRRSIDNTTCPGLAANEMGAVFVSSAGALGGGATASTRDCCGGDDVGLAVTDLAVDRFGRANLSFLTSPPGMTTRGHLLRFRPGTSSLLELDPDFGDAGFGTYNRNNPALQAELYTVALDPLDRLLAGGAYTSAPGGNPSDVDNWAFRVRDNIMFKDSFE